MVSTPAPARRWSFRLAALIVAPLFVVVALELGLRLVGAGYPTSFTLDCRVNGVDSRCDNPRFSWRFFPREIARSAHSFAFSEEKPARTVRIFLVGGSAAQGDPDPSFGAGRILQALFEDRYPGVRFEIVNAAITAVNSHVVLPVVRDLSRHDGDLFIVYLGNNEVVGPYGAGTIFSPIDGKRWLTRASLFARSLRLGQLIAGAPLTDPGSTPDAWRGMEMFLEHSVAAGSPRLQTVYDHFQSNLGEIIDTAMRAGAGVILTTVPSNLDGCAPFASLHRADLTAEDAAGWERHFEEGVAFASEGRFDSAIESFAAAERIDAEFAELHYRLARTRLALGQRESAWSSFVRARDLDVLRFRADSRINEIIRGVGSDRSGPGLRLVDADRLVAEHAAGDELFHEHVHLNFDGNYLLALKLFEQSQELLPDWLAEHRTDEPPLTRQQSATRLAYTEFDRQRIAVDVRKRLERPPFTNQSNHDEQLARLDAELENLSGPSASTRVAVAEEYRQAIRMAPTDPWLHHNHAVLLAATGNPVGAADEFRTFLSFLPHDIAGREQLCVALVELGRFDEGLAECETVTEAMPHFTKPYYTTAYALARMGQLEESIEVYEDLLAIDPGSSDRIYNEIGRIQLHAKRPELAAKTYRKAISVAERRDGGPAPDMHYNYAFALKHAGETDEARAAFRRAAELYAEVSGEEPDSTAPLLAAGGALIECGEFDGAASRFREAANLDPADPSGHLGLVRALDLAGKPAQAVAAAREGILALEAAGRGDAAAALRNRIGNPH